jgi:very-short-patch-repair endonuclease
MALAEQQHGVVSRAQAMHAGLSPSAIGRRVATGCWSAVHPGVYHVNTGSMPPMARLWAAWLYAESPEQHLAIHGQGELAPSAFVAGEAALWLAGVVNGCPTVVDIATARQVRDQPGVRTTRHASVRAHPALLPPRVALEAALLSVVGRSTSPARVVDLVLSAGQRRLTTPARIVAAADELNRLRWRSLVLELCADLADGLQTPLERRYERTVERPHGLPHGDFNAREAAPMSGAWYRDVRYRGLRCVVELDGRAAHPIDEAFRDRRRDNHAARQGDRVLRYGWREIAGEPCAVAAEVAGVLAAAGWVGSPHPCRPLCPIAREPGVNNVPLSGMLFTA